ncbi:Pimeloyl-ACP methyl ester carboxylesterase [Mucilaginibacter polytrichastri]|nr:Pimeloyl-ACP methyl ester carboxylesterase [Mucilaginibacter polytrichastri]
MTLSVIGFTTFAQKNKTIVLVHGAWTDASSWQAVTPLLKAKGHEVIEVNLPGHGKDSTAITAISFQSYVETVKAAIGDRKNVILVGHSMSGLVVSQVAEEIPGQISKLIYLAAFLPKTGESLLSLAQTDAGAHIGKYLVIDKENGIAGVKKEGIIECFAADAPPKIGQYIADNLRPEPLAPLATPVTLTPEKFGSIKKVYIHTVNDMVVSIGLQERMVKDAPNVVKEYTLQSSHTPFISMPDKLAAIILTESK